MGEDFMYPVALPFSLLCLSIALYFVVKTWKEWHGR
jgi:hypothetical protein